MSIRQEAGVLVSETIGWCAQIGKKQEEVEEETKTTDHQAEIG